MKTKILLPLLSLSLIVLSCGNKNDNFDATGTFEATEVTVSAEAQGNLIKFTLDDGDSVRVGNVYGIIDTTELYLSKMLLTRNAKSIVSNRPDIAAQVASLKEQITKQKIEQKRIIKLLRADAATQKQLDDVNSSISILEGQLSAMISTLNNNTQSIDAQSSAIDVQVAQINYRISKSYITSPISGIVLDTYAEQGEVVRIGTPLFKVADIENMILRAYVTSDQLSSIKIGQEVNVIADFGGSNTKEYCGKITWIADKSEFTPKSIQTKNERANLVYAVKIAVKNDGVIKIGMYGLVKFK